jgi:hypothetical protein
MNWQRTNIQAAVSYLRERIAAGADDARTRAVYEGLLDVLEPARRNSRLQREAAEAARAAVKVQATRERRASDRRSHRDRRQVNLGPPGGVERRRGGDRRSGRDRRKGRS